MSKLLLIALSLMSCQLFAVTVISERFWCEGTEKCTIEHRQSFTETMVGSSAITVLLDQWGYQGMENRIGSTHSFYCHNTDGIPETHTIRAKLCDMRGNCANYEKEIRVDWKQVYNDVVYLSLHSTSSDVGREPIFASTDILYYPDSYSTKQASLFLQPFPYDMRK